MVQIIYIQRFLDENPKLFRGRADSVLLQVRELGHKQNGEVSVQQLVNIVGPLETEEILELAASGATRSSPLSPPEKSKAAARS